ncbi:MAG: hypothetical protein ACJA1Z_003153 [Patiriisocius sp.]|jgi:hypothetical protein
MVLISIALFAFPFIKMNTVSLASQKISFDYFILTLTFGGISFKAFKLFL